ncbi:hypothetical protein GOODEAATRI_034399, partial [Goodea atripinnis]
GICKQCKSSNHYRRRARSRGVMAVRTSLGGWLTNSPTVLEEMDRIVPASGSDTPLPTRAPKGKKVFFG